MAEFSVSQFNIPENLNPRNYVSGDAISGFFLGLQSIVLVAIVVGICYYFFIYKRSWKDLIEIWDISGSGLVEIYDRGKWYRDKTDGTGYYSLWKYKQARLKQPRQEDSILLSNGKRKFRFLKFEHSPFGFAQLSQNLEGLEKDMKEKIKVIPLADIDWGKYQIKKEVERKNLGKIWETYKAPIILASLMIFALLTITWIIGFANDSLQLVTSEMSKAREDNKLFVNALQSISNKIDNKENGEITEPPPI